MKFLSPFLPSLRLAIGVCLLLTNTYSSVDAQADEPKQAQSRQLERQKEIKSLPSKTKRWALIIGVDDYSESQISKLNGAANDARTLADALIEYAGFPKDQVTLLASDQPSGLQPRRSTILRYLSNLRGLVPKDGLLLISFAGHGIERGGRAFLLPSDALGINDMALLEDTAISVDRVKESIRATGVGQVVLILDACRSDPAPGRSGGDNLMTADFRKNFNFDVRNREIQAFVTLYATAVGERAYEYGAKRQGYFTWALIEGLRGAASNDKNEVTLASLLKYVQVIVPKFVQRDLGSASQQKPFAVVEGYRADELVIATSVKSSVGSDYATTRPAEETPDVLIWEAIKGSTNQQDFKEYIKEFPNGRYVGQAQQRIQSLEILSRNQTPVLQSPVAPARSSEVNINQARVTYIGEALPVGLHIGGTGWNGGSDIKVMVNGKDVSAKIHDQSLYVVTLRGSIKDLNLQDGKNEVFVIVNTVSSNTTEFKLFRPTATPAADVEVTTRSGVTITYAGYASRYVASTNRTSSSLGVFFTGQASTRDAVKVTVNGNDLSQRIAARSPGYVSLSGSVTELNLHNGENEVLITVNGMTSNSYKFKVSQK